MLVAKIRSLVSLSVVNLSFKKPSNPDAVGFLAEFAIGYREFEARWNDGTELHFKGTPLEARIGIGVDIRLTEFFSISPLLTVGGGAFGSARFTGPNTDNVQGRTSRDQDAGHGWFTAQIGGHFDIFGSM